MISPQIRRDRISDSTESSEIERDIVSKRAGYERRSMTDVGSLLSVHTHIHCRPTASTVPPAARHMTRSSTVQDEQATHPSGARQDADAERGDTPATHIESDAGQKRQPVAPVTCQRRRIRCRRPSAAFACTRLSSFPTCRSHLGSAPATPSCSWHRFSQRPQVLVLCLMVRLYDTWCLIPTQAWDSYYWCLNVDGGLLLLLLSGYASRDIDRPRISACGGAARRGCSWPSFTSRRGSGRSTSTSWTRTSVVRPCSS